MFKKLKEKLHSLFLRATHATSDIQLEIKPAPIPYNWDEEKAKLLVGDDLVLNLDGSENKDKITVIGRLLDNTYTYTKNSNSDNPLQKTQQTLVFPLARQVMSNVLAWDIVGVQFMTMPVSSIFVLSFSEPTKLEIKKEIVEAKSHKFAARFALEINQHTQSNVSVEEELKNAIASELVAELDARLLDEIMNIAATVEVISENENLYPSLEDAAKTGTKISLAILRVCNKIAELSHRGAGNWCIVSPSVGLCLSASEQSQFVVAPSQEKQYKSSSCQYVGKINNTVKVYVNPYAKDETIIVGYKGVKDIDSAIQFCPYIPVLSPGIVIDPTTFQPTVAFATRQGLLKIKDAGNYYGLVKLVSKESVEPKDVKPVKKRAKKASEPLEPPKDDVPVATKKQKKSKKKNSESGI